MSYSVRYTPFSAIYDEGYIYDWPDGLSKEGREYLKKILIDNNRLSLSLSELDVNEDMSDNRYFIRLSKGAVLFRLGEHQGDACKDTAIIGIYIEEDYVTTAWLMIDKLMTFLYSEQLFEDTDGEYVVYEDLLDEIYEGYESDHKINENGEVMLYSFAISIMDPHIPNVKHYPLPMTEELINRATNAADNKSLEAVFNSKKILQPDDSFNRYKGFCIERNTDEAGHVSLKDILFRRTPASHSLWKLTDLKRAESFELESVEDGKMVKFRNLLSEVDTYTQSRLSFDERG